jgi:hypothetical protein
MGFRLGFGMISFDTFGIEAESLRKIKIASRKRNSTQIFLDTDGKRKSIHDEALIDTAIV